jgi:hypothetical protein
MTATEGPVGAALIARVLGEYREMPGLALTLSQAQRMWGCDEATCRSVVDLLVGRGILRWSRDGRLVRGAMEGSEMWS